MEQVLGTEAVLCTADEGLAGAVVAAAAAVQHPVVRTREIESLVGLWRDAAVVIVGADLAVAAARMGLPARDGVYVLADARAAPQALSASVPLAAGTIVLPEGGGWLADVLAGRTGRLRATSRIAVLGGSGGVGASTFAVGLASAGSMQGSAVVVDLDPLGGGVDLLLGAERAPGWRWDRLRAARGQIGDLRGQVPQVGGVEIVSMARDDAVAVPRDAVAAVVASLSRAHDLVVMDVGRTLDAGSREALRAADRTVLVCGQDVRGVASARMTLAAAETGGCGVVVRLRKGGSVRAGDVAAALALPLWGTIPADGALSAAAERGVPPDRAAGRRWLRACAAVLGTLGVGVTTDPVRGRS